MAFVRHHQLIAGLSLAIFLSPAFAGTYDSVVYGPDPNESGSAIAYDVTNKFTAEFPHRKWQIFLYNDAGVTGNGAGFCYAIAGVVPRGSGEFPLRRFTYYEYFPSDGPTSASMLTVEADVCGTQAVKDMMKTLANGGRIYVPKETVFGRATK